MLEQWVSQTLGKKIDIDGWYGDQCVDVAMSYAMFLYPGHGWQELLGIGNAKDLYGAANPNYFDKPKSNPQAGDMVVFGATRTNAYGHIAVIIAVTSTQLSVVEQNGFNPSGVAYQAIRPYINIIGYLRPKGLNTMDDKDITAMYLAAGKSEADANSAANHQYYRGKKPEQLANDLYKGNNTGNPSYFYKASHYDTDIAAAKASGVNHDSALAYVNNNLK